MASWVAGESGGEEAVEHSHSTFIHVVFPSKLSTLIWTIITVNNLAPQTEETLLHIHVEQRIMTLASSQVTQNSLKQFEIELVIHNSRWIRGYEVKVGRQSACKNEKYLTRQAFSLFFSPSSHPILKSDLIQNRLKLIYKTKQNQKKWYREAGEEVCVENKPPSSFHLRSFILLFTPSSITNSMFLLNC